MARRERGTGLVNHTLERIYGALPIGVQHLILFLHQGSHEILLVLVVEATHLSAGNLNNKQLYSSLPN